MEYLNPESFLGIFVSAAAVIMFGALYAGLFALVKMEKIRGFYLLFAYFAWGVQTYSMVTLGFLIKSDPYTQKILFAAMIGYLVIPHIIYYLVHATHQKYEHIQGGLHE